jgi:hypothetical protein
MTVRLAALALAVLALGVGIATGLLRLGLAVPVAPLASQHAVLMVAGFLGTVIALERAVAYGSPLAYAAPLASGLAALALVTGFESVARALWLGAGLVLVGLSVALARRQPLPHMVLLAVGAAAWLAGNTLHAVQRDDLALAWWFSFLVLTIAAERLEMTRLMRRRAGAAAAFAGCVTLLLAGAAVSLLDPAKGGAVFGLALAALAAWLCIFDIARRTLRAGGFAGYAAAALLAGYAWLAIGGVAWLAWAQGVALMRDTALHALGLGFVMSMVFGHAPLVVPAIARRRMRFSSAFYAPLVLLHLSVAWRLAASVFAPELRWPAGLAHVVALALFVTVLARSLHAGARAPLGHGHPAH